MPVLYNLFGDCVTQQVMENRPHLRAIGLQSIISVMSKPMSFKHEITENIFDGINIGNYEKRCVLKDIRKETLDYLLEEKADYLVLDFTDCRLNIWGDENLGRITDIGDAACVTISEQFRKVFGILSDELADGLGFREWSPVELKKELYISAIKKFCSLVKEYYSNDRIILNKQYFADDYIEDEYIVRYTDSVGVIRREKKENIEFLDWLFPIVRSELQGCYVFEFPRNVIGVRGHRLGLFTLHYHDICYQYARDCISEIENNDVDILASVRKTSVDEINRQLEEKRKECEYAIDDLRRDKISLPECMEKARDESLLVTTYRNNNPDFGSIENALTEFCKNSVQDVFILGAGVWGKKLAAYLELKDLRVKGFAVDDEYVCMTSVDEKYLVIGISEANSVKHRLILASSRVKAFDEVMSFGGSYMQLPESFFSSIS